jgi:hypothetical protein
MIVAGLDRINTIVTDDGAKTEELEDFRSAGIKVIVAKVTEEDEMKNSPERESGFKLNFRFLITGVAVLVASLAGCSKTEPEKPAARVGIVAKSLEMVLRRRA